MLSKPDWLATPHASSAPPFTHSSSFSDPLGCWLSAGTGGELSNGLARSVHAAVTGSCCCGPRSAHFQHSPPSVFIQKRVKTKTTTILNGPPMRTLSSPRVGTHMSTVYPSPTTLSFLCAPSLNRYRSNGHVDVAFYIF